MGVFTRLHLSEFEIYFNITRTAQGNFEKWKKI